MTIRIAVYLREGESFAGSSFAAERALWKAGVKVTGCRQSRRDAVAFRIEEEDFDRAFRALLRAGFDFIELLGGDG